MFGSLKEKLKNWTEKVKKEVLVEETPVEIVKVSKKKGKKSEEKSPKESKVPGKKPKEKEKKKKKVETPVEIVKEGKKENKSFKNFFKKDKTSEIVLENIEKESLEIESLDEEQKKKSKGFFHKELTEEKFEELFEELAMNLLQNNVAYSVVEKIKIELREKLVGEKAKSIDLEKSLIETIENLLIEPQNFIKEIKNSIKNESPYVILFSGINGSGKTTTIARMAHLLKKEKLSVCLAAADTFRSAAIEQLEQHAKKLDVPIVKKEYNHDPASVGFETIVYAKKHKIDVVLIDTAGRMNSSDSLMKEIEKIARVTKPNLKIFVGESITGNDATNQAKAFDEAIGLDGIILTKADIDEKAGTILSVSSVTGKPIYFLGVGQGYDDLEVFEKDKILKRIFS
ncbi:signal recognition particle-docking protein FtsY [archaeon]|nr:signal recognition particle-docking protein FtsY [archaeon]